jgi:hypothetical protein
MTSHKYIPAIHDPILSELNQKWRRTDQEIADEMGFDKLIIRDHRIILGLPANYRPRPVKSPTEQSGFAPAVRTNPIVVAQHTLGRRLQERPAGFFLDNVPVSLATLMKETNRVRVTQGHDQIGPDLWRV